MSTETENDKNFVVMFDTSKKEMLNPNKGYKKIVQKIKNRYKCEINKTDLKLAKLKEANLLLLGAPTQPFSEEELMDIKKYIDQGGRVLVLMNEGGEKKQGTNINFLLEQLGISVNRDAVIRKSFFKYLHPKEAFIGNGILNRELVTAATGQKKEEQAAGKYSRKYRDDKDELANRSENGGLNFVYSYGASLNVRKPAFPILSSGPISFPPNRPVGAFHVN